MRLLKGTSGGFNWAWNNRLSWDYRQCKGDAKPEGMSTSVRSRHRHVEKAEMPPDLQDLTHGHTLLSACSLRLEPTWLRTVLDHHVVC